MTLIHKYQKVRAWFKEMIKLQAESVKIGIKKAVGVGTGVNSKI